jgi:two-component system, cell cycle sensor histidine kinase DivJ
MLALASAPAAMVAAFVLMGLLPAAIALDCRSALQLNRASIAVLLVLGATLAGAVLRGLPVVGAVAIIAVAVCEACLCAGRRTQTSVAGASLAALALVASAGLMTTADTAPSAVWTAALSAGAVALAHALMLTHRLVVSQQTRNSAVRDHMRLLHRSAALQADVVISLNRSGCVQQVGRNARSGLGLMRTSLLGRGLTDLTLVADRPRLLAACAEAFAADAGTSVRFRLKADNAAEPRYRWANLTIQPAQGRDAAFAALRDIADIVADEERRTTAAAASEQADAARAAFLSTVNHELRTPLNAIVGFSELLANPITSPADTARVREYAGLIHEAGHDLMRKFAAMIDITRIQAGAYDVKPEREDIAELVRVTVDGFRQDRALADETLVCEPLSPTLMATVDGRALRSALGELLANAVRHGIGKPVHITGATDQGSVVLTVRDSGPGVPSQKLALLHSDLTRLDESLGRTHGGMGLGLTLARGLMRLHGGQVVLANAPGGGFSASLRFPIDPAATRPANVITLADARTCQLATAREGRRRKRA